MTLARFRPEPFKAELQLFFKDGRGALPLARRLTSARLRALKRHKPALPTLPAAEVRVIVRQVEALLEGLRAEFIEAYKASLREEGEPRPDSHSQTQARLDALLPAFIGAAVSRAGLAVVGAWGRLTGVPRWRWQTVGDDRVRPEHRALNGKTYKLGEGDPVEGMAGDAWGCRCQMVPL